MSKKNDADFDNPFLNIDKSRFVKAGDKQRHGKKHGAGYEQSRALKKLARKSGLNNTGQDSGVEDDAYFASMMNMGGVSRLSKSQKISKGVQKDAEELTQPVSEDVFLPEQWLDEYLTEPVTPDPKPELASTPKPEQHKAKFFTAEPAQGSMAAMLVNVAVKSEQREILEELSEDKKKEDVMLREYLAAGSPKNKVKQSLNSKDTSTAQQTTGFDDSSEQNVFAEAMQQVSPLSGKGRAISPEPTQTQGKIVPSNPLQDFMDGKVEFSLEFTDEYIEGHVLGLDPLIMSKMRAGAFSYEAHLDLHGFNTIQAFDALVNFIRKSYQQGKRNILLIPGRGKNSPDGSGILRDKVQEWLTQEPLKRVVLGFCTALPKHGGAGALYVLLRKFKKSSGKIIWDRMPSDPDLF